MNTRVAGNRTALTVVTTIFFMWGFITALNDVLIPHLKSVFTLNYTEVMLVQFTFFGAYFLMSLPSGKVVSRLGYRLSIVAGLIVTGIGALLFLPASMAQSYPLFLLAFFVLASGITLLQVAANPYVSLLGPPRLASSRLNLAQALNSLGTTIAPKLGGLLILSVAVLGSAELAKLPAAQQAAYKLQQAHLVQGPYLGIAIVLFLLALIVWLFHLPAIEGADERADDSRHTFFDALAHARVWLGMLAIFVYVGAEVSIGSFMINYISLPGIGDMPEARAAGFVSLYWGGAMVGRFAGSALLTRIDPRKLLCTFAVIAGLLVLTTMLTHGHVAMWSVIAIGLFNSIMFPNIFTLGIEKFGPLAGKVSSLLVMAIVGGAVIPLAQGALADRIGVHHAFVLPLLCYAYIVFYSVRGSRVA
ncbi:MAG: putative mannose transporter, GGP family [Rhodanobacteraceae bacterium]|jgi:FHS family L-fucose permease-like MFS transporter|nr:MAG: putative mannose transporter, GGP family [Rhodanobacteraceae bacterium]